MMQEIHAVDARRTLLPEKKTMTEHVEYELCWSQDELLHVFHLVDHQAARQ